MLESFRRHVGSESGETEENVKTARRICGSEPVCPAVFKPSSPKYCVRQHFSHAMCGMLRREHGIVEAEKGFAAKRASPGEFDSVRKIFENWFSGRSLQPERGKRVFSDGSGTNRPETFLFRTNRTKPRADFFTIFHLSSHASRFNSTMSKHCGVLFGSTET